MAYGRAYYYRVRRGRYRRRAGPMRPGYSWGNRGRVHFNARVAAGIMRRRIQAREASRIYRLIRSYPQLCRRR